MIVKGIVEKGKGEARFFTLLPHYQRFFRSLLGAGPYPGTLNVLLKRPIRLPRSYFPNEGRPIWRARVRRINKTLVNAIAVIPGKNVGRKLEIVSTMKLRKLLGIKNGQEVMLSVGAGDLKKRG